MNDITVAELFAGVGGFRLGLEGYQSLEHPEFDLPAAGPFKTIWANQWEPPGTEGKQFAWRCYEQRFGEGSCVNQDINKVLDDYEAGKIEIPDVQMVVGGFPCQDYSVASTAKNAKGIEGSKGVLWWQLFRFIKLKKPKYLLLENVDRLLKSPSIMRGRDFAIMLSCLASLGYSVEWQVINSGEYGFDQRRKRIYIFGVLDARWDVLDRIESGRGVIRSAFPIEGPEGVDSFHISSDPYEISKRFNVGGSKSLFKTSGAMQDYEVFTFDSKENYDGHLGSLGNVLSDDSEVDESYYISDDDLAKWRYVKGAKNEPRTDKRTGYKYTYSEGAMSFPDDPDKPSRTVITGESGKSPSRFKHVVKTGERYRRLVPDELDQLQGFPKGWTSTGMSDSQRAFCAGNALVVGIPHRIGAELCRRLKNGDEA